MTVSERIWRLDDRQVSVLRAQWERVLAQGPASRQSEAQAILDAIALDQARRHEIERVR